MKEKVSIRIKAILLLIVFSMNTVIGFACAVGINMGFNTRHHGENELTTTIHVHADGKKHDHHNAANKHTHEKKKSNEKDNCCNNKVIKFQNIEKTITAKTIINVPVFLAISSTYLELNLLEIIKASPQKNIKRFFYPPPPDILISIQKFQV